MKSVAPEIEPVNNPVTYDALGRMQYHPDFHQMQGKRWQKEELQYICDFYNVCGPEEIALGLERTIHTVMQKASELRKVGWLPKQKKRVCHKRASNPAA